MAEHIVIHNHTPHEVVVVLSDGSTVAFPPRRPTPRLVVERIADGVAHTATADIPLTRTRVDNVVVNLPARTPGTLLIVAQPIVAARPDREDLVFPDEQVRDERQRVVGCRSLGRPRPGRRGEPSQAEVSQADSTVFADPHRRGGPPVKG